MTFDDSEDEDSEEEYKGKKFCQYHGMCGHTTDECTTLKALVKTGRTEEKQTFPVKVPCMRSTSWCKNRLKRP